MSDLQQKFPINLGKPSLRRRLEAYYSVVAPSQVANNEPGSSWLARFDEIWKKFGGTHQGEAKLAAKLAKKYGTTVQLLTVAAAGSPSQARRLDCDSRERLSVEPEERFVLSDLQRGSGVLDFTSDAFDPHAALKAPKDSIEAINTWMTVGDPVVMGRVDQCCCLLATSDPLYRPARASRKREPNRPEKRLQKQPSFFLNFVASLEEGPFSILHKAMMLKSRVRVLIRYVNGIRGTMTGFVMAFDKHFNILLSDAEEVYSPRCVDKELSNVEWELQRRLGSLRANRGDNDYGGAMPWFVRRRKLRLSLIRGDNVVLVYKTDDERSAFPPPSNGKIILSIYRANGVQAQVPSHKRVGTPGSLAHASLPVATKRTIQKQKRTGKGNYTSWM